MEEKEKNGVLYERVSASSQLEGDSIEAQDSTLKRVCKDKNIKIVEVYVDGGKSASIDDEDGLNQTISGDSFSNVFRLNKRPMFKKLLQEAPLGKFNCICFTKWCRFSRDISFADLAVRYFKKYNIKLIPVDDSEDPFVSSIMQVVNKQEIVKMKSRVHDVRKLRFEKGIMIAKAPFGYRFNSEKKIMEIDKRKADIVKSIFEAAFNGIDYKETCAKFGLHPQSYYNILKNEVYTGIIQFESQKKQGIHTPIISRELFDKVQEKMKNV